MGSPPHHRGQVQLVGAGPGDPGLITLRGLDCLRRADAVLYDYLVNPILLEHTRPDAQLICLGSHHERSRILPQEEINARMIELARAGKRVVRLKGGDPAIFAHQAEESAALAAAGVPCEIVPGITAALAAGSHAGIPLTHREAASAVALVTGQENPTKQDSALDWQALARFPGTLVIYMGVTTAPIWSAALMAGGQAAETPVAVVRRCSLPDQEVIRTTLGQVAGVLTPEAGVRPPVIVIVGEVAALDDPLGDLPAFPLAGKCVLVTRPTGQAAPLRDSLRDLGANVLSQPAIEIGPPADWRPVDKALQDLSRYDWVVFSSSNGVCGMLDRLLATGRDLRALGNVRLAAIGPGTAEELARYHLQADLVPEEYRAEGLAEALAVEAAGKRFLLARASRGREVLAESLRAAGGEIEQVVVYESRDVTQPAAEVARRLAAGQIDWITVTSSAIARSLAAMFGEELRHSRLVSISPVTSATLRELGHEPAAEAREYTMEGVARAILEAEQEGSA